MYLASWDGPLALYMLLGHKDTILYMRAYSTAHNKVYGGTAQGNIWVGGGGQTAGHLKKFLN